MMRTVSFSYATQRPPKNYKCADCGVSGCKLWREYQTCSPQLLCCDCAGKNQKRDVRQIDDKGQVPDPDINGRKSVSIGWYVPAVPDEEGLGYWGYTSVPDVGVKWWEALPTRAVA